MIKMLFFIPFLLLFKVNSFSQTVEQLYVYDGDRVLEITADEITISDDGTTFTCSGDVETTEVADPDPGPGGFERPCGPTHHSICGKAEVIVGPIVTTIKCVGSYGRCALVYNPI
jgi:hypothetical protein